MTAAISISMPRPTANMDLSMAQDQVVFWLHDEESTVTAQKIQQECVYEQTDGSESGLTRFQGSSLLKQLYETDPSKYVATVVRIRIQQDNIDNVNENVNVNENETIPITTFSCESNSNLDSDSDSTILALSKKTSGSQIASESLESSHETDMAALRDRLFSDNKDPSWFYNHSQLSTIQMAPSLGQDENIMPATPEEKTWHKLEKNGPIVRTSVNINTSKTTKTTKTTKALINSSNTTTTRTGAKPKPVKPTTAKSFFSKKPAAASKPAPLKSTKPSDSKTSTKPSSAFTKRVRPEPKDQEESKKQEEKTDAAAAKAAASVGNADDFVGDEDEDSEDEQEMEERREKSKEIVRKQKQQDDMLDAFVLQQQEDLDLQEEKPVLVKGAMDAFATKQTKPKPSSNNATTNAAAGKKRRKVLKEKTTVNAQGFLVTTTEAVWEDVSSDEEDTTTATTKPTKPVATKSSTRPASKLPAKKANPKAKKPSDMKQGSLMGFFAVKKK